MVLEIKSIGCIEGLRKVPEIFGLEKNDNWLNSVCYSFSTKSGTLVFAYRSTICVLSNEWDNRLQLYKYSIIWSGELDNPNDEITSILCLPVVNEANESSTDSTCILVGLNSGYVHFLTSRGRVILTQQWYSEPVQNILIQNEKRISEEIYIVYKSCVCILQSKQLMQSLKSLKLIGNPGKLNDLLGNLSCRIWKYGDSYGKCDTVTNSAVVGSKQIGLFDHLLAASMEGGFHAKYRNSAPQQLVILSTGVNPFVAFYYAKEIFIQPMLTDVARVVANKVKNALPSWFPGAQQTPIATTPTPSISTELMTLRYGLYDDHRSTARIWLAARNQLAAISDSLGRVILIDCTRSVILRVWKGYRDAQCSFMQIDEKLPKGTHNQKRKHALFLAIYSPRRSTVDIWNIERGKKLAVFPVGSNGQLIQCAQSNAGNEANSSKSSHSVRTTAFFLNPIDFTIKELTIPFHYALDTSSSKKSKDSHIINQLKLMIKSFDENQSEHFAEISELCDSIQTNEMRFKCVNTLLKNRHLSPNIFNTVLNSFLKNTNETDNERDDKQSVNYFGNSQLFIILTNYQKLVNFFVSMKSKENDEKVINENDFGNEDELHSNFDDILKVIETYKICLNTKRSSKVTIQSTHQTNTFIEYLSIFECSNRDNIILNEAKISRFTSVAFDLFNSFIANSPNLHRFLAIASDCSMFSKDLSRLFLKYWMEKEIPFEEREKILKHLTNFTVIAQQICELDRENVQYMYNSLSSWWQDVREILLESPSVFKSLLAAMLCRDISIHYRQTENSDNCIEDEPWEEVSQEAAQWSLLIGKLDDIAALSSILTYKPIPSPTREDANGTKEIAALPYTVPDISLVTILNGGKGILSELVAKWIASTGISPEKFFANGDGTIDDNGTNTFVHYLSLLRKHFPFSLRSGVLLAYMIREYMHTWSENIESLEYFNAALDCLETFKQSDYAIKHGVICIIWNQYVRQTVHTTIKLINRVGHETKANTSYSQHEFSDALIPEFITCCDKLLNQLVASKNYTETIIKFEELLQEGKLPLSLSAIQQDPAINELISLHFQLNQVILLITSLNVNYKNPIHSLFNETSQQSFGCEINTKLPTEILRTDEVVNKQRRQFLRRTINSAVDLIRNDFENTYLNDYELWIERLMSLAKQWNLNLEDLLKYQVIQLYTRGWDELAETKLNSLAQPSSMGKTLLLITGTRLNEYIKDKPDVYSRVVSIGTLISSYLETLDESDVKLTQNDKDNNSFLDRLIKLARKTYQCFDEQESQDLRLAAQIFDACAEIRDSLN